MHKFTVRTQSRNELVEITAQVRDAVRAAGIRGGSCVVYCPHTTAAITIQENADPDVVHDMLLWLNAAVPKDVPGFRHAEGNSDSHIKSEPGRPERDGPGRGRRAGVRHVAGGLLLRVRRPAKPNRDGAIDGMLDGTIPAGYCRILNCRGRERILRPTRNHLAMQLILPDVLTDGARPDRPGRPASCCWSGYCSGRSAGGGIASGWCSASP